MTETTNGPEARPAVQLQNVGRQFGADYAVRDVTLDVAPGELICLLGASGSGKTTLLRLIAGFDSPTEGAVILDGQDVSRLSPSRREIGMVFQNYALFPTMSVEKNIEYGLKMRGWNRADRAARATEMLERMQLERFAKRHPSQLSGGQQQRVAIARALAYSPRLVLMDEPLGALDKALKQEMLKEIRQVHREFGATILYVTHDREEALTLADRVAIMRDSRLVSCEPVEELFLRPRSAYVAEFFTGANTLPVAVSSFDGATATVAFAGQSASLPAPLNAAATRIVASARPRDFSLIPSSHSWRLDGIVTDRSFFGDDAVLSVASASDDSLRVTAHVPLEEAMGCHVGSEVSLFIELSRVRLVEEDRSAARVA